MTDDTDRTPDEARPPAAAPVNPLNDPATPDGDSLLNPARTGVADGASDEAGTATRPERTSTSRSGGAGAQTGEPPTPS